MRARSPAAPGWSEMWGVPAVLALVAVLIFGLSFVVPTTWLFFLQKVLALSLFAVATNLLIGYGGMVSFGQAVFYGLGAYMIALGWQHYDAPFWLLLILAPLLGALAALVIGVLALRTRQFYFALLTLAFSQLFFTVAGKWYDFTNGANGVFGPMIPSAIAMPQPGLWFILAVTVLALLVLWGITISPFGLTLRAIRENQQRVEAIGVNLYRHKLYAFVISGAFCALAGALFVVHDQSAYPELLDWMQSGEPVLMALIGGLYHFLGPAVGAVIFVFAHDYLVAASSDTWQLILGLALVLIVLFAPNGILGLWHQGERGGLRGLLGRLFQDGSNERTGG